MIVYHGTSGYALQGFLTEPPRRTRQSYLRKPAFSTTTTFQVAALFALRKGFNCHGPKPTADEALDEMHRHEANPGSYNVIPHAQLTPRHQQLVDEGIEQNKRAKQAGWSW